MRVRAFASRLLLVGLSAGGVYVPAQNQTRAGMLFLITGEPTPTQNRGYPAELYRLGEDGKLTLIREVVPAGDGVYSVEVSFECKAISIASPHFRPHHFSVVRLDDPYRLEGHDIDYDESGFNTLLLDMPGHRLVQSLTNSWSPAEQPREQASNSKSPFPLPTTRPLELKDLNAGTVLTRHLGVDLSPDAARTSFEIAPADLRYATSAGDPGGSIRAQSSLTGRTGPDGKMLVLAATPLPVNLGIEVSDRVPVRSDDLVVYHSITPEVVVISLQRKGASSSLNRSTIFYVYDRKDSRWASFSATGNMPLVRTFGRWISVTAAQASGDTGGLISPGKTNRRSIATRTGGATDERFAQVGRYFPGQLVLYDSGSNTRYELDTKEGDSEVILAVGNSIYYRVNDEIYVADASGGLISNQAQLLRDELVRDVHWAFLGL